MAAARNGLEELEKMVRQLEFEVEEAYDGVEEEGMEVFEDFASLGESALLLRLEGSQNECARLRRRERGLRRESGRLDVENRGLEEELEAAKIVARKARQDALTARDERDQCAGERRALEKLLGQARNEHSEDLKLRQRELEVATGDFHRVDRDLTVLKNDIDSLNAQILYIKNARSILQNTTASLSLKYKTASPPPPETKEENSSNSNTRQLGSPFGLWVSTRFQ